MPTFIPQPPLHDENAPAIELKNVNVVYDGITVLDRINLLLRRGDQVAVVGPNGAGKSTLFQVITGMLQPQQGMVRIGGSGPDAHICVGYVPQRNRIDWRFPVTVRDVVMMGRVGKIGLFHWPRRHDQEMVDRALAQVGLLALANRQIGELSGGQQQRVFLARTLAQEAEVLLLDEPFAGLDLPSQETILELLGQLHRQGITMLVATHDLNQAAEHFARILLLNRRIVAYGPADEVLTPEHLLLAYGSHMHQVQGGSGALLVADSCCGGGELGIERYSIINPQ